MAVQDTTIYKVGRHLYSSGLLDDFEEQLLFVDESKMDETKRYAAILQDGSNNSPVGSQYTITPYRILMFGLPINNRQLERFTSLEYATAITDWIKVNFTVDCISQIRITGGVSPIMESSTGRPVFQVNFEVWE